MSTKNITKSFTVTGSPDIVRRFERFLALLHHNSNWGHSAEFGMYLDGDGSEKLAISPKPGYASEVNAIGGVGYDVELAANDGYYGTFIDRQRDSKWLVYPAAVLYKNGKAERVYPDTLPGHGDED